MRKFVTCLVMTKILVFAILLLIPVSDAIGGAKKVQESLLGRQSVGERSSRIAAITGEVLTRSEVRENLRVLCDEIGGRVSGTDEGKKAREFAERLFHRYGLANVHQEPFEMPGWERGPFLCEVTAPRRFVMHAVALANTPSTPPDGVEAEVIDVGHGNPVELDRLGDAIKGKFALAVAGAMPGGRWMHRYEVMAAVAEHGAAGLLYQTTHPGNLPMTGMCWKDGLSPIPGVGVSKEDGEWIQRSLHADQRIRVRIQMTNLTGTVTSANVVGEIPGRGSDFILVGAHLDAWDLGQGAVDNGTGTVVIVEAARALSRLDVQPEATIRFVLFMGEESGLCGSRAYVRTHERELSRYRAMINCDMEGTPLGVRVMGHEEANQFFADLITEMDAFDLTSGVSHRAGVYGDHLPFLLEGVPVISPISRPEDDSWRYYHTTADTYDKVTYFKQLNLDAAFVALLALELASTPGRVMEQLDEDGVKELISKNNIEEVIRYWGSDSE